MIPDHNTLMLQEVEESFLGKKARARREEKKDAKTERKIAKNTAKQTAKTERTAMRTANGGGFLQKAGAFAKNALSTVAGVVGSQTESIDINRDGVAVDMKDDEEKKGEGFTKAIPFIIGGVLVVAVVLFIVLRKK